MGSAIWDIIKVQDGRQLISSQHILFLYRYITIRSFFLKINRNFVANIAARKISFSRKWDINMIQVLLLDGHPIFRVGVEVILASNDSIEFLGSFNCFKKAQTQIEANAPNIILYTPTTLDNPDWLMCTKSLVTHFQKARLIAVLHTCEEVQKRPIQHKKVFGMISKKDTPQKVFEAILKVNSGDRWISPCLIPHVITKTEQEIDLTFREIELLNLLAQAKRNQEIAEIMHISERTVRYHLQRVKKKIGVKRRIEAVVWAIKSGLVLQDDAFS